MRPLLASATLAAALPACSLVPGTEAADEARFHDLIAGAVYPGDTTRFEGVWQWKAARWYPMAGKTADGWQYRFTHTPAYGYERIEVAGQQHRVLENGAWSAWAPYRFTRRVNPGPDGTVFYTLDGRYLSACGFRLGPNVYLSGASACDGTDVVYHRLSTR